MRYTTLTLALALLVGCATIPTPKSRSEWEQVHMRTFPGKSQREVLDAAEKVLAAADHDFKFDYPPDKLVAYRRWTVYAVLTIAGGTDYWTLETRTVDGQTQGMVQITQQTGATTISPSFGPGGTTSWGADSYSTPGQPVQARASYDLFWARVESVLYGKPWVTCEQFKAGLKGEARGAKFGLETLCSVTTDDKTVAGS
ncbi:hypothetical protein [Pseudoxanthomonas sp. USHLN014]|uniref:hypothetical protein n=1 Tax=Pseudoxanthomonas sp. USHLN014 TaxID=3081297 RepID=UPI00301C1714